MVLRAGLIGVWVGFQMVFWGYKAKTGGIEFWRYGYGVEVECRYGLPSALVFKWFFGVPLIGVYCLVGVEGFRLSRKRLLES